MHVQAQSQRYALTPPAANRYGEGVTEMWCQPAAVLCRAFPSMLERAPILPVLIFIAVTVIGGIAMYYAWKQEKQRRLDMLALAEKLALRYDPGPDTHHDHQYAHFEIFRRGFGRRAFNTISGTIRLGGRTYQIKMGDFRYKQEEGSGKNRRTVTYTFSYCILHLPFRQLPDLLVRPEGVFDRLAGFFGAGDIDFESDEFSRRFHVASPVKRFAYDLIDQRMMEYLLRSSPPMIDIEYARMCLSDGRTRWAIEQFERTLGWTAGFVEHWPDHLVRSLEEGDLSRYV